MNLLSYLLGKKRGEVGQRFNLLDICLAIRFPSLNIFDKSEVILNLPQVSTLDNLFRADSVVNVNKTVEHLTINCKKTLSSMANMIYSYHTGSILKRLTLNLNLDGINCIGAFYNNHELEIIDGTPINASRVTGNGFTDTFRACSALREVRFQGSIKGDLPLGGCPLLSADTLNNILGLLSDESTGKTITFSAACINARYETSPGANDGSTSEAWASIVASKPNWTFALV